MKRISTACVAFLALASTAVAQGYPTQIVKLVAPYAAGGPADLLAREIAKAVARPDVKEKLATLGFKPVANTPDEWTARIKLEIEKSGKVVKDAGLRIE